ncbi:YncE family protein [Shimia sp.]|uniref:YncE family protein n=1 Tax=Shimia sp. TaxID=1954381 RepID=UPI00329A55DD
MSANSHNQTHQLSNLEPVNNPTGRDGLIGIDKVGNAILFMDPVTLETQKVIAHKNHHEVAVSPDHKLAYASEFGKFFAGEFVESGAHISVVDLGTQAIVQRIPTGDFKGPHAMRFDTNGDLWVIFEETGELGRVDTKTMTLAETFDIGAAGKRPPFLEITPNGERIYVSCKLGNIIVFDVPNRSVVTEIDVPHGTEGIALSPDGTHLYAAENTRQDLLEIETATNRISRVIPLKGAVLSNPKTSRLIRLRFSPDGKYLVSTNYASGVMHIHDAADPAIHELLPIAKGPQGIAFDADSTHAIVSNHDCGLFTRIHLKTAKAVECVPAGKGIEALTYY